MKLKQILATLLTIYTFASVQAKEDTTVFARYNDEFRINLSKIFTPIAKSIKIINSATGEEQYINAFDNEYEVKVVGKANDMYEIKLKKDGQELEGLFLTDPSNIAEGVNWAAVKAIVQSMDEISRGALFEPICLASPKTTDPSASAGQSPSPEGYSDDGDTFSNVLPDTYVQPSPGEFHPGCEVLATQPIPEENRSKLKQCIQSIQLAITQGNRDAQGRLNYPGGDNKKSGREKVFESMYTRLKPEEQVFAAYIFTATGEAAGWTSVDNPEESMLIMKVLQNRKATAIKQGASDNPEKFNELDVALYNMQFSMYNSGSHGNWQNYIDPSYSNFSGVIEAYMRMTDPEKSNWDPEEEMNNVTHYHREWIHPTWEDTGRRVYPTVNGVSLRSSSNGGRGYNKIYSAIDGRKNWAYSSSVNTFRP